MFHNIVESLQSRVASILPSPPSLDKEMLDGHYFSSVLKYMPVGGFR